MMSELTRLHEEAARLLETYTLHKDSEDEKLRRKAHLDLDWFLMNNRETAIICIEQILKAEIDKQVVVTKKGKKFKSVRLQDTTPPDPEPQIATKTLRPPWYQRLAFSLRQKRGGVSDGTHVQPDTPTRDA